MGVLITSNIFDKSLIYIMNSSGPSMDPWGTPLFILAHFEFTFLLSNPFKMAFKIGACFEKTV
jgi:hypothetical protein